MMRKGRGGREEEGEFEVPVGRGRGRGRGGGRRAWGRVICEVWKSDLRFFSFAKKIMDCLRVATLNARGLKMLQRRTSIYLSLKMSTFDVCFLQNVTYKGMKMFLFFLRGGRWGLLVGEWGMLERMGWVFYFIPGNL